jgi:myo-inositol catabolism protein IolC
MWYSRQLALRHYLGLVVDGWKIEIPSGRCCGEEVQSVIPSWDSHVRAALSVGLEV